MTAPVRPLLFVCCHYPLKAPLQGHLARVLPHVELLEFDAWLARLAQQPGPAVALIVDNPDPPTKQLIGQTFGQIKTVTPECTIFVYGDNPHQLITRTPEVEEVFSAGMDEDRLVDALRRAFGD